MLLALYFQRDFSTVKFSLFVWAISAVPRQRKGCSEHLRQ
jgi:hypothetical protein